MLNFKDMPDATRVRNALQCHAGGMTKASNACADSGRSVRAAQCSDCAL